MKSNLLRFILLICMFCSCLSHAFAQGADNIDLEKSLKQVADSKADTNKVLLLNRIASAFIFKPGEEKADLNTAINYAKQAEALSDKLNYAKGKGLSLTMLSSALRENGQTATGKQLAQKAVDLLSKLNYPLEAANACIELASYYNSETEGHPKIKLYEAAVQKLATTNNILKLADAKKYLGDLYGMENDLNKSYKELKESLALYQAAKQTNLEDIYGLLGNIAMALNNSGEALKYGLLSAKIAEAKKDSSMMMCAIYNRLGMTYMQTHEYQNARHYYEKGVALARKNNHKPAVINISGNLANVFWKLGQYKKALALLDYTVKNYPLEDDNTRMYITAHYTNIYIKMQNFAMAEKYCRQMLKLASTAKVPSETYMNMSMVAIQLYILTKRYDEAKGMLAKCDSMVNKSGFLMQRSNIEISYFKIDSAQGRYISAIKHYQRYKANEDSLFNQGKNRAMAEMQVEFDSYKKDQDIAFKSRHINLLTKQSTLQKSQLEQAGLIRNLVIGGIVLLAILLGVIFNRFQIKKRSNVQLEAKQLVINKKNESLQVLVDDKDKLLKEREWLLKEIHHRVKNNLQIVISLLNTQSAYLNNDIALDAIRESQNRMHSISLIHQKLYQSDNLANIDMFEYITDLVTYLEESFDTTRSIEIVAEIEPICLDVAQAVPIGLILNEAITNSIKYAFNGTYKGKITIALDELPNQILLLTITDNGQGIPGDFDLDTSNSLGMSLMRGLSQQIGGTLELINDDGLTIKMTLPIKVLISQEPGTLLPA
jgi:two-component sensor histidine kinase